MSAAIETTDTRDEPVPHGWLRRTLLNPTGPGHYRDMGGDSHGDMLVKLLDIDDGTDIRVSTGLRALASQIDALGIAVGSGDYDRHQEDVHEVFHGLETKVRVLAEMDDRVLGALYDRIALLEVQLASAQGGMPDTLPPRRPRTT